MNWWAAFGLGFAVWFFIAGLLVLVGLLLHQALSK